MQFDEYITSIQRGLARSTQLAPDNVQRTAEMIGQALEPEARLALTRFASDLAEQITAELDGAVVEIHIRGGEPAVVVEQAAAQAPESVAEAPVPPPPASSVDPSTARLTLRLPESLKSEIEKAAAADGKSTNTWIVQAAQRALTPPAPSTVPTHRSVRRMTGWAH